MEYVVGGRYVKDKERPFGKAKGRKLGGGDALGR